jgi:hypothetical protein
MIMKSGCDTGYYVSGSNILKGGSYCNLGVGNDGQIKKNGSDTGYFIKSGSIVKESDKGHSIEWMFN